MHRRRENAEIEDLSRARRAAAPPKNVMRYPRTALAGPQAQQTRDGDRRGAPGDRAERDPPRSGLTVTRPATRQQLTHDATATATSGHYR